MNRQLYRLGEIYRASRRAWRRMLTGLLLTACASLSMESALGAVVASMGTISKMMTYATFGSGDKVDYVGTPW